ncbi:hypothetical protein [Haladaptatus sp. CMSO5]|uniref:hypothetical protein n=1 Tax=Haladaptatus sp. CMSO5 TaxID=3120514 RepID=UPI002FCE345C
MVSARRLISLWTDLILTVWVGLLSISRAVIDSQQSIVPVIMLVTAGSSLLLAYLLLRRYPNIQSRQLWGFNAVMIVFFVAVNAVVSNGIYAPQGDGSPLVIGALWIMSLAVAYGVVYAGGYSWAKHQLFARNGE